MCQLVANSMFTKVQTGRGCLCILAVWSVYIKRGVFPFSPSFFVYRSNMLLASFFSFFFSDIEHPNRDAPKFALFGPRLNMPIATISMFHMLSVMYLLCVSPSWTCQLPKIGTVDPCMKIKMMKNDTQHVWTVFKKGRKKYHFVLYTDQKCFLAFFSYIKHPERACIKVSLIWSWVSHSNCYQLAYIQHVVIYVFYVFHMLNVQIGSNCLCWTLV